MVGNILLIPLMIMLEIVLQNYLTIISTTIFIKKYYSNGGKSKRVYMKGGLSQDQVRNFDLIDKKDSKNFKIHF